MVSWRPIFKIKKHGNQSNKIPHRRFLFPAFRLWRRRKHRHKLSVVFDDLPAARETQNRIREFVRNHPTVYCGTHTPQGYENLEAKRVMDLDNPVHTVFAEVDFSQQKASGKYVCSICGYVYDPAEHDGVPFEELPDDWKCPRCKQGKEKFNKA